MVLLGLSWGCSRKLPYCLTFNKVYQVLVGRPRGADGHPNSAVKHVAKAGNEGVGGICCHFLCIN